MKYAVLALVVSGSVFGATITPNYQNDYSFFDLGPAPGVQTPFGGMTFLAGDPDTLLIAGGANAAQSAIDSLGVVRDAQGISASSHRRRLFSPTRLTPMAAWRMGRTARCSSRSSPTARSARSSLAARGRISRRR